MTGARTRLPIPLQNLSGLTPKSLNPKALQSAHDALHWDRFQIVLDDPIPVSSL